MFELIIRALQIALRRIEIAWYYAARIWRKLTEDDVLFLAAGLSFNGILTLLPMMFLAAAVFGSLLHSYAVNMGQLNEILNAIFPPQPFAEEIKDSIRAVVGDVVRYRHPIGILGFVVLIWSVTSIFDALRTALHRIYELKRIRGLFASLLHEIGFIVLVFILFIATNFAIWVYTLLSPVAMTFSPLKAIIDTGLTRAIPTVIIVVLTAVMFYIVYRYITDTRPPRAAAVISTVTTTILWIVAGRVFALYIENWSIIGLIYGPYAFLLVLFLWIYISSFLFVLGGIVGQVYWERHELVESGLLKRKG
ncbi:MAG TPA: YihY/virulence factor BrkB family protein [Bacteroidota bacterium]|nr:YihY/virulence factor BrkB family protein [Bacteroidota bacterium]